MRPLSPQTIAAMLALIAVAVYALHRDNPRFQVQTAAGFFIKLDTATGRSWIYTGNDWQPIADAPTNSAVPGWAAKAK